MRLLDALGHGLQPEAIRERDNGADDGLVVGVAADVAHKGLIDLEAVQRQQPKHRQARVAGAEVIQRELGAERLQCRQRGARDVGIAQEHGFGDFQFKSSLVRGRRRKARIAPGRRSRCVRVA